MYLVPIILASLVQTWLWLILFPPCFTMISGVLPWITQPCELSVVRELSPSSDIIDIGTNDLSRATVDTVIVSVVSTSVRSWSYTHWRFFVLFVSCTVSVCTWSYLHWCVLLLFVWCTVVYAHGHTYIDVSFSCLYGVPLCMHMVVPTLMYPSLVCMVYRCVCTWSYLHWCILLLFVWCTVVYAHGRTYIDVSFSCLYGVPLVYARGHTHIDRALAWLGGVPFMCGGGASD